ncbi:MAG: Hsp20/alpha crystallin family protein [Anderseniella sp.]|jgi:HSP20 family protein|nr:Hsp20/alpha crystallin family protein [Anderseniella sp.]
MANPLLPRFWGSSGKSDDLFSNLHREIDRVFEDFTRGGQLPFSSGNGKMSPRADLSETDKEIELTVELPGVEEEDIDISLAGEMLTVRGEKKSETEKKDKDYHVVERSYGMFERATRLPCPIDEDKIDAVFRNGVLKITLPKAPEAQTRSKKIAIKAHH